MRLFTIPSLSGYRYYIHFLDDYHFHLMLYLPRNKPEVVQTFWNFNTQVELQPTLASETFNQPEVGNTRPL